MFILKAESLGVQDPSQPSLGYLGKVFGQLQQFPNRDRTLAEERCRILSKSGQLSLLVEFTDKWVLYSEGATPQVPLSSPVQASPAVASASTPVSFKVEQRGLSTATLQSPQPSSMQSPVAAEAVAEPEPEYREIRYRGSVIRQPIAPTNSTAAPKRTYRGSSY